MSNKRGEQQLRRMYITNFSTPV